MNFRKNLLILSAIGFFTLPVSFSSFAQDAISVAPSPTPDHSDDPYYPNEVLPSGPHKGEHIPVEFRRSIKILHQDDDQTVTVANFAHNDSFYLAKIPLNGLEKIYLQIDYFTGPIPAAHSEIRLRFREDSPILLYPQLLSQKKLGTVAIREAVFSIEAVKSESTALSFMKGFGKNYAIAYRFISLKEKRRDLVEIDKEHVTQFELNLDAAQMKSILTNAVVTGDKMGVHYFYNTWKRNCTTELIRILDKSVDMPAWRLALRQTTFIGAHYPVFVKSTFRSRGLLGAELKPLDQDDTLDLSVTPVPGVTLE